MRLTALVLFFTLTVSNVYSQSINKSSNRCKEENIPHYTAYKINDEITIDGKLDEAAWKNASRSGRFKDLVSGGDTYLDTRAAILWDEQYLYVAYWIEEPNITATHTQRDALIYEDNDVELFIAGKDGYYEFEVNSFGTIYEVLFFWLDAYEKNGYHKLPEFKKDTAGVRVFNGVGYKHPRGSRLGFWNWDISAFKSFEITESAKVQFRAEFFNAFNNVRFNPPNMDSSSPFFGQIQSAQPPRIIQMSLRFLF